ncbi:hypothetical protein AZE42_07993 [Rhizopogon vesiculosus]|uniref:Uncharacterized protein n=1 Tax=Rhizopogon vesiculosus TaxID=180088 RepID=A0A1J8R6H1_9AGAM|nr:hypothetical protein AZE42_07993 [Rhizopogon vesiculosus]
MPSKFVSSVVYMPGLGAWRETSVHVARDPVGSVKRSLLHSDGGAVSVLQTLGVRGLCVLCTGMKLKPIDSRIERCHNNKYIGHPGLVIREPQHFYMEN